MMYEMVYYEMVYYGKGLRDSIDIFGKTNTRTK